jgi:hypothetical protein
MREGAVSLIRREDYTAPAFWVRTVDLSFDLDPAKTLVISRLQIERNSALPPQALRLHGEDITLTRDYVLLRTILQQMATYATPLPKKDAGKSSFLQLPPLKLRLTATRDQIVIEMPVTASASDQKKNAGSLKCAQALAPACKAQVDATPKSLQLLIQR